MRRTRLTSSIDQLKRLDTHSHHQYLESLGALLTTESHSALAGLRATEMDVVKAVETYVTKLVSTPSAIKVLLLDAHTVRSVSKRMLDVIE